MFAENPARQWEKFGRENPYFGVNSDRQYAGQRLEAAAEAQFFAQGEAHIDDLMALLRDRFALERPGLAVDFGVGVGRLALPLARRCGRVWGVDISAAMIARASDHATKVGLDNLSFCHSVDDLPDGLDLVHSYIVLQHVPMATGWTVVRALFDRLRPGGVGALHVPVGDAMTRPRRLALELQKRFAPSRYAFNVLRGYPMANPVMQMNIYNVGELALYLMRRGAINVGLAPVPAAWPGVYLLFHKGNALDAAQWWGPGAEGRA